MNNILNILILSAFLSGCTDYGGEWPKLNAPLPDEADRKQVIASPVSPVVPARLSESKPVSFGSLTAQADGYRQSIESLWSDFRLKRSLSYDLRKALATGSQDLGQMAEKKEEYIIAWADAQLTLSRVSSALNSLRDLMEAPALMDEKLQEREYFLADLRRYITHQDKEVSNANDSLEEIKPDAK